MSCYRIEGGRPLEGCLSVQGAKNSVLPILAAALLAPGESMIHNCPDLSDVSATLDILSLLGCRVEREGDAVRVDASCLSRCDIPDRLMREMRSSVIFLGALLPGWGRRSCPTPGDASWAPGPSTCTCPPCAPWGRRFGRTRAACAAGAEAGCGGERCTSPCQAWGPPRMPCWPPADAPG